MERGVTHAPHPFAQSRDWERASLPHPQADAALCKWLQSSSQFHPHMGFSLSNHLLPPLYCIHRCRQPHVRLVWPRKARVRGRRAFWSLTDLKWGEFEEMDFGSLHPSEKKLQFDLTESAGKT
ncbi:hypothetical protein BC827DRAFT_754992 [Russula dissimulans]|nr:hypothetical protein BC827DRAFT_754992 [Russula dissimulans]